MGEGPAHVGAAKGYQSQGLVYDVRKHGSQEQKSEVWFAHEAGGGKGEAQVGKEEHQAFIDRVSI